MRGASECRDDESALYIDRRLTAAASSTWLYRFYVAPIHKQPLTVAVGPPVALLRVYTHTRRWGFYIVLLLVLLLAYYSR